MKRNVSIITVLSLVLSLFSFNLASAELNPTMSPTVELTSAISNNVCTITAKLKGITTPLAAIGLVINYDANVLTYNTDTNNLSQNAIGHPLTSNQISATKTNSTLNLGWYSTTIANLITPNAGEIQLSSIQFKILQTTDTIVSVSPESSVIVDVNNTPPEIFINKTNLDLAVTYTAPATPTGGGTGGGSGGGAGGGTGGGSGGGAPVVPVVTPTNTFTDLDDYDWASEAIYRLSKLGIVKGTSETTFSPANNITRADFAVLLTRTLNLKNAVTDNFNDVSADEYFYEPIGILKALSIAQGSDGDYRPYEPITRQDIIVLTHRALTLLGDITDSPDYDILNKFSDKGDIADYAIESVCVMITRGIIKGSNEQLSPLNNATRAEAAVIFNRIYDILPK